jgi:tetratricopeptide (TPR) repeat protein
MGMSSQQLAEDFRQLKDILKLYPKISVVKTVGQPPDNYEIIYNIRGYVKDITNAVVIDDSHRIRFSLPFGYPHFAPTVKPLSPVFHPDFDPAAIRIADQWQQNPSLAEIVLHVGEMISGNVFNLKDPFSQEAAEWYQRHQHQLPLDSLRSAIIERSAVEIDFLNEDTFTSLDLEKNSFLEAEKRVDFSEIEHIRDLISQNKYFTANKLLADLPESIQFQDRDKLQQDIGKVLRKTDQLFRLAKQLEDKGNRDEALEVVANLLTIAADAPGVDTLHARIQKTSPRNNDIEDPQRLKGNRAEGQPEGSKRSSSDLSKSIPKQSFIGNNVPYKPLLAIILSLGVCIGSISLYFKDQNVLSQSQANLLKGQLLIDKKQFESALETLEKAKTALADLSILRFRKNTLEQAIETLLSSTDLQEGLKGRILYKGEYITTGIAASLAELSTLTDQAQGLAKQNKIEEALSMYRQALKLATEHGLNKQQPALHESIKSLELREALLLAEKAESGGKWEEAAKAYRKALNFSGNIVNLGTTNDITQRLTAATFRHEMDLSQKAFTQSHWQETIKFLEHAQQTVITNPNIATDKERQDLHRLLVNSQLYLMLSTAREAYQQKKWDVAIKEYQNALSLLASESGAMENTLGESISKIEKTLLMVKVSQIQDKVLIAESSADLAATLANSKEIQQLIRSSGYANDPTVKIVLQKVSDKIDKNQEKVVLNERIAWLEEHYEEIFRSNYPTVQGSKLLQPKAVFLKKFDNKTIFTINCLERSQGTSSKLELNYMFDGGTGKWSLYSGR